MSPEPARRRRKASLLLQIEESERDFQQQVLELAQMQGWDLRYHTYDSRRSAAGFPDIVLLRPPRVVFMELKRERGRITPDQGRWLDALWDCPGVEAYLFRPSDLQRIAEILGREYLPGEGGSHEQQPDRA